MPDGPPQSPSFSLIIKDIHHQIKLGSRVRSTLTAISPFQNKITAPHTTLHPKTTALDSYISTSPIPSHTTAISSPSPPTIPTQSTRTMPSSSTAAAATQTTKTGKTYTPSVASSSTSSSTASYTKPVTETNTKRSTAILNSAKRLLADIGSSPTAAYDLEQAAKGEQTDSQKAFYINQMPRRT